MPELIYYPGNVQGHIANIDYCEECNKLLIGRGTKRVDRTFDNAILCKACYKARVNKRGW